MVLTERLNARSDVELPANLATLIPILFAVAVLLSEWLDRPPED